jgi:endonuclease YncB( thermonuclease family)
VRDFRWAYALALAAACFLSWHLSAFAQNADNRFYKVRWVADGDTLILEDGRRVRYLGINAPETAHDDSPTQPIGKAARRYNRQLVEDQMVRLEFDQERRDRFGRWLAHLYRRDGLWVNRAMVAKGLAIYLYTPENTKHGRALLAAQGEAMKSRRGLWQPGPAAAIWQGRYLGNRRSRRFHAPSCRSGRRTSRRNQIWFDSQWDAYRAGYAPGSRCLGRTPGATPDKDR